MFTNWELTIYTSPVVADILAAYLTAGTVTRAEGIWLGLPEDAAVITVVTPDATELERTLDRAKAIGFENNENYLLATIREVSGALIATDTGERLPLAKSIIRTAN